LKTIGKLGLFNGAIPSLISLLGFGSGLKSGIGMLKNGLSKSTLRKKLELNVKDAE